jgi:hypothetical protein
MSRARRRRDKGFRENGKGKGAWDGEMGRNKDRV